MRASQRFTKSRSPLPPPRFSLRSLVIGVTGICILLSLSRWMEPLHLAVLILAILAVGVHMAGNAIGTALRDGLPGKSGERLPEPPVRLAEQHFAPVSNLSGKQPLGWMKPLSIGLGTLGGMAGGWFTMHDLYGNALTGLALVLTLAAFGVLGCLAAFVATTFVHYSLLALRQSHRHD